MPKSPTSFKPGQGGRKKGAKNKFTTAITARIEDVLCKLNETLLADIDSLTPAKRVEAFLQLQEYVRPKLSRKEHTGEGGGPIDIRTIRLTEVKREGQP
ncbi:hypothetical protein [Hymenobacter cellulosilyticus]|uniref:Uncharacterized protein n=1 Tax=Hymenobacter cellulosilyticus TaxID=2932248 RepID=A0A8T9Q1R0_9BACT|nr:hypothetical protein [Hymenobacter cellulosilyticus]UOQ70965.1 hypothetical protein MUN79_20140 [Hymenobacter cellulosilyticus]